jgi:hypothetical protein
MSLFGEAWIGTPISRMCRTITRNREHTKTATAVVLLLVSTVHVGCASDRQAASIPLWQKRVVKYVRHEGNGDPTVLRDVTIANGSRRGFAVIGGNSPSKSTDAVGALLGHPEVNGQRWFVYLVGLVKNREVKDIRLAALAADIGAPDERMRWELSAADDDATRTYLKAREQRWKSLFPDRKDVPLSYTGFPVEDDAFRLDVQGERLEATHEESGARWELVLPRVAGPSLTLAD